MNNSELSPGIRRIFIVGIALLICFAAITKGAHDLWAATVVYLWLLGLLTTFTIMANRLRLGIRLPLLIPSLMLLIALLISFRRSVNPSESFLSLMDWISLLAMFYLCSNVFQTESDLKLLLALLVPIFLIEYVVMFRQWLMISYMVKHSMIAYEEPVGTFVNGNSTVAFALLWIPGLIEQSISSLGSSWKNRWYWVCGLVALALVLLMVSSTWSVVCLFAGILISVGKSRLQRLYVTHRRLGMSLLILILSVLLALIWYKLALIYGWGGVHANRYTPTSRISWWMSGFKMWKDHPWFGVGIGNYPSAYLVYKTGSGQNTLYAHGVFVQILAETGAVGLLTVSFFISSCFYSARSALFGPYKSLTVGLLMFLLFSTLQVSFEYLSHLLALGLILGILVAQAGGEWIWEPKLSATIVLAGLAIFSLPYVVSPFFASRLIVDGEAALAGKKWDAAEKKLRSAIDLDPRAWEPYQGLALCAASRQDFRLAADLQKQAVDRNKLNLKLKAELKHLESHVK